MSLRTRHLRRAPIVDVYRIFESFSRMCVFSTSKRLHTLPAVFTREIACFGTSSRRNWLKYSVNLEGARCDALSTLAVSLHSLCIFDAKALMEPGCQWQIVPGITKVIIRDSNRFTAARGVDCPGVGRRSSAVKNNAVDCDIGQHARLNSLARFSGTAVFFV